MEEILLGPLPSLMENKSKNLKCKKGKQKDKLNIQAFMDSQKEKIDDKKTVYVKR